MTDRAHIEHIAGRVAAGERVDWASESPTGSGAAVLRNLRVLEALSRSLEQQAVEQDQVGLVRHLNETFDTWLDTHVGGEGLAAPESWGRLRIDGLHGSGARADVFRAWDPRLERAVALKLFRTIEPGLQERLLAEGRKLAQVDHPNVVRILEAETHDGRVGLIMESVQGRNLDDWTAGEGPMGADEARAAGLTMCRALAAVHGAGVLHRDIKAQNVLRQEGGRLVLADLGSAIGPERAEGQPALSGTPLYLAPEVLRGAPPSVKSDVYALGVLLFYLVTSRYPVEAESLDALSALHRDGRRQHLTDLRPDLDAQLVGVIERAIAAEPDERFESMGAFAVALGKVPSESAAALPRRRTWRVAALLVALALAWAGWTLRDAAIFPTAIGVAAGYQVEATLYRLDEGGLESLPDGARVSVGDRIGLSFTASEDVYVYLFNVDQRGHAFALFPLPALGLDNPLATGDAHWLPGSKGGGNLSWLIDRAGGKEEIHLVTSPSPLPEVQSLFDALPPAQLANSALGKRGMGSLSEMPVTAPVSAAPLLQAVREAGATGQRIQGAWSRVFVLAGDAG